MDDLLRQSKQSAMRRSDLPTSSHNRLVQQRLWSEIFALLSACLCLLQQSVLMLDLGDASLCGWLTTLVVVFLHVADEKGDSCKLTPMPFMYKRFIK